MRFLLPLLLLAPMPASAQIWDGGHSVASARPARPIDPETFTRHRELRRVDRSIREGRRRGELTRREARELRAQVYSIGRASGGFGQQLSGATLNIKGLVDAKRAQGRARKNGT